MKVLFAPDWRVGNPYQQLFADALGRQGVEVIFAPQVHGLFRLTKTAKAVKDFDLLHFHWPEAYFPTLHDKRDFLRRMFFPMDLRRALAGRPMVYTAHNLYPHNCKHLMFEDRAVRTAVQQAKVVFAHSHGSVGAVQKEFDIPTDRFRVIPLGDLSVLLPPQPTRAVARAKLGLSDQPICLMFGAVDPYKGIEAVLDAWENTGEKQIQLAIVGSVKSESLAQKLLQRAQNNPRLVLRLAKIDDAEIADWMAACDCMLFNYVKILTSGSACLARARGVPTVLPARLTTVDLLEPCANVVRFEDNPQAILCAVKQAILAGHSSMEAARYQAVTSWDEIARQTADVYRSVLKD